jgi:hypothetical protein
MRAQAEGTGRDGGRAQGGRRGARGGRAQGAGRGRADQSLPMQHSTHAQMLGNGQEALRY